MVVVIRNENNPKKLKPEYADIPLPSETEVTGNDDSGDDAQAEPRNDKDEDLKDGDDKDSPLAKPGAYTKLKKDQ